MEKEFTAIQLANRETIKEYFNIIEETPVPSNIALDLDYWAYLETLYNNIETLGKNILLALSFTPYINAGTECYTWNFIFHRPSLDIDAINNWLADDCYTPIITHLDQFTTQVTINAI